jgi:hypothetical protein|tara:strand:- start:1057 stop:1725 length:669 start_codon:yes stop_codon:yes gene_type:complete
MSLKINQAAFRRELRQYARVNKRSFREIVNAKALDMAFQSLKHTDSANPGAIEYKLGAVGNKVSKNRKTGALRKGKRILKDDSFAARIVNSRLKKAGKPLIWGKELEKAAQRLINMRVRAVRFLKSGWMPAIKKLSYKVDRRDRRPWPKGLSKGKAAPKGWATPAKEELRPEAWIANSATNSAPAAIRKVEAGLSRGMAAAVADMRVYIERKLGRDYKKAGF